MLSFQHFLLSMYSLECMRASANKRFVLLTSPFVIWVTIYLVSCDGMACDGTIIRYLRLNNWSYYKGWENLLWSQIYTVVHMTRTFQRDNVILLFITLIWSMMSKQTPSPCNKINVSLHNFCNQILQKDYNQVNYDYAWQQRLNFHPRTREHDERRNQKCTTYIHTGTTALEYLDLPGYIHNSPDW